MSLTSNDPVSRIERLERESADLKEQLERASGTVNLLQWMIVILVAAAIGVPTYYVQTGKLNTEVLFDQGVSKTLEAQEFGLHNRDGKRMMFVDYDKFGLPYQLFFDKSLNCKLGLYMTNGNGEVTLYDNTGMRASYHMMNDGEARIELFGEKKKGGIVLSTTRDGTPRLTMTDASGKVVFEAPSSVPDQKPKPEEMSEGSRRP
jgi:hypothetical protein